MSKVEKNESNLAKCSCPPCPSYNECANGKNEKLFCAGGVGKSSCSFKRNGDLCGACPVHAENGLKKGYYCIQGSADEIG